MDREIEEGKETELGGRGGIGRKGKDNVYRVKEREARELKGLGNGKERRGEKQ